MCGAIPTKCETEGCEFYIRFGDCPICDDKEIAS